MYFEREKYGEEKESILFKKDIFVKEKERRAKEIFIMAKNNYNLRNKNDEKKTSSSSSSKKKVKNEKKKSLKKNHNPPPSNYDFSEESSSCYNSSSESENENEDETLEEIMEDEDEEERISTTHHHKTTNYDKNNGNKKPYTTTTSTITSKTKSKEMKEKVKKNNDSLEKKRKRTSDFQNQISKFKEKDFLDKYQESLSKAKKSKDDKKEQKNKDKRRVSSSLSQNQNIKNEKEDQLFLSSFQENLNKYQESLNKRQIEKNEKKKEEVKEKEKKEDEENEEEEESDYCSNEEEEDNDDDHDEEEDDEDDDDTYDEEDDDEESTSENDKEMDSKKNKQKHDFNIIFTTGGFKPHEDYDNDDEYYDELNYKIIENTDNYDSGEDEKNFMKEKYQKIDSIITTTINDNSSFKQPSLDNENNITEEKKHEKSSNVTTTTTSSSSLSSSSSSSKNKNSLKSKEIISPPDMVSIEKESLNVEKKYLELLDLKKTMIEKLKINPENQFLWNVLNDCKTEIKNLVDNTRIKNTKNYYKLTRHEKKNICEMDYFKKKLSNKEQVFVMNELKEINEYIYVDKPYRLRLLELNIPKKYKATVMQKLNILRSMEQGDPEYYKIKNWVDTFMRIPFNNYNELSIKMSDGINQCSAFMENSIKILDDCVYGLNDAKMQILQMIGQWIANPNAIGTAIAIHGPPGTGKTAIIKDGISKILGREFAFIALGGAGDASFLEGHSYTYEGSSWGKIVQILIDSKCMNPVIFFDELDKISDSPRGEEITNILTHLTDTTQNNQFHDKFFSEIDFDLSKCLFVFSYNDETKVNPILKDRMYRIKTKGYDTKEKLIIANKYLLPKIRKQVNFNEEDILLPDETLQYIISDKRFSQSEAGVRNLKRCLEIIFSKLNLYRLVNKETPLFEKEIPLKISFPHTVSKSDVDALIKHEETNQSLLSMYI